MPAAAVIPAPIAYIKVVAVKKLVVGLFMGAGRPGFYSALVRCSYNTARGCAVGVKAGRAVTPLVVYFEKIGVFKAGVCNWTI